MKNQNEGMEKQNFYLKELNTTRKSKKIIVPLRPNMIKMVIKFKCLKLSKKLMRRHLQRRTLRNYQGITQLHSRLIMLRI